MNTVLCPRCITRVRAPEKVITCPVHDKPLDGGWCHGCQDWVCQHCGASAGDASFSVKVKGEHL